MAEKKRIAGRAQNESVEKWLNSQSNLNMSMNNVISHMIRIFGYEDITNYDIQEFLFHKISSIPFDENSKVEVSPKIHTIFTGPSASGKTTKLKKLIMEETNDFKVIISEKEEFLGEVKQLQEKGYNVVTASNSSTKYTSFSEQLHIAFETSIESNKVLIITTKDSKNGFDPALANAFFEKIIQSAQGGQIKIRIYIDAHASFFNQIPRNFIHTARTYNCLVFSAFQVISELEDYILENCYINDVKRLN